MSLVLNGSGTITGLSAGGLPSASVTQASLATGVAGTGPAFSAYQSSAQTLSSITNTKIQLQAEEFDTNSNFNNTGSTVGSTPAYAFLPTVAGYYQITASLALGATATTVATYIYKNGSLFKQLLNSTSSPISGAASATALVYLNGSTDYVEFYGFVGLGQALAATSAYTYFQGSLVRAA